VSILNMSVPRSRLTTAINSGPSYLRPIMLAVRDAGVSLCVVPQGGEPFEPPHTRPAIVLIGDDMLESQGPAAFHKPSLLRFVSRCRGAVIVACEPLLVAYASAAAVAAGLRQDVVIVETRPRHEADWKAALDAANPALNYILCTTEPAGGIQ
jgi:hypothetical protein